MSVVSTDSVGNCSYGSETPRRRSDLIWSRGEPGSGIDWVVKDPIALKYFRMRDDERLVLDLLDGNRSENQIRDLYNSQFSPRKITTSIVRQLIQSFFRDGLLIASHANQSSVLHRRLEKARSQSWLQIANSWLFVRLPGIYANDIATKMERGLSPWLNGRLFLLCVSSTLLAWTLLVVRWSAFQLDAFALQRWMTAYGLITFTICIAAIKSLHELGHAVACKHLGGDCHEIGVMFMFGVPCLYCDTTDAWRIPNRSHRMVIGFAGLLVEILIASVAIFVWSLTGDGFLHWVSVDIILVCLAGSILFNANPLLRYDGYYILSDWIRIPNLQSEAKLRCNRWFNSVLFGWQPPVGPERSAWVTLFLIVYSIASSAYRVALLFGLGWLVLNSFRRWGYEKLGWQAILLASTALSMAWLASKIPGWSRHIQSRRWRSRRWSGGVRPVVLVSLMVLGASWLVLTPFEHTLLMTGELHSATRIPITSPVAGRLTSWLPHGRQAASGEKLVQLHNLQLDLEALQSERETKEQQIYVDSLSRQSTRDSLNQVPTASAFLKSLREKESNAKKQRDQQNILSPRDGLWISSDWLPARRNDMEHRLVGWERTPLSKSSEGCWIEAGTTLGWIVDPSRWEASVLVEQGEIERLRLGQEAWVTLIATPERRHRAKVVRISRAPASRLGAKYGQWPGVVPAGAGAEPKDAPAESEPGIPLRSEPHSVSYWVTVSIVDESTSPSSETIGSGNPMDGWISGEEVRVKVKVESTSYAQRIARWVAGQFRL